MIDKTVCELFAGVGGFRCGLNKVKLVGDEVKELDDWKKQNGKYIPYPSTWLNQKRWEDEVITISESNNPNNIVKYSDEWWNKLGSDSND